MSNINVSKEGGIPISMQIIIIVLSVALVSMALLTAYKFFVREPTVDPKENDLKFYLESLKQDPKDIDRIAALGYAYQLADKFPEARQQYLEVIKKNPKHLASLYNLGVIAQKEKKYPEAEKYFNKAISYTPDHVLAGVGLGEVYLEMQQYNKAITTVDKMLKVRPDVVNLRLVKAKALEKKGEKPRAKAEYQQVLRFVPDNQDARDGLARIK
jgi:tetratricopeptide (TPR) repeat protein